MKHQVLTGPFSALERRFLETIVELQRTDPLAPVPALVGSNILAAYLRRRIAEDSAGAANVRFYTFLDLVNRLAGAAGSKARLTDLAAARILEDLLAQRTPAVFRQVAGLAGFRAALLATFRDLRDAGVSPQVLNESVRALFRVEPERADHLRGLSDLFAHYRQAAASFHDAGDDFRLALDGARDAPRILQSGRLLVYGVYDVTGLQSELLDTMSRVLDITLFVPFVDESASGFAAPFLKEKAAVLRADPTRLPAPQGPAGLSALAERIFSSADSWGGPLPDDGSFVLLSVPGDSRAAVEIVREILRAVREGVIRGFYEAAVILRHPEEDVALLGEVLRTRGIPYYLHGGSSFAARPLARAVASILALETEGFARQAVLAAMESIGAALPEAEAGRWQSEEWRALTNDYRFLAGADAWESGTRALLEEAQRELADAEKRPPGSDDSDSDEGELPVESARRRLESARMLRAGWEALRDSAAGWPASLPWSGWARLLEERLEPLLGASEDWERFSTALDDLAALEPVHGAQPVARSRALAALGEALASLTRPEGRFLENGINLLSTAAARGLRFPMVIVPGLEEGKFPARLRQDPLLLDRERERIGKPSRLPLKSLRAEEEKLLFDMAVRAASRRLVLVASRLDESSDRERIPSDFFLRAAAAARGEPVGLRELAEGKIPGFRSVSLENPVPAAGLPAVDRGEIRLRLVTEDRALAGAVLESLALEEPQLLQGPLAYDRARWQPRLTAYDGRIARPDLLAWLRSHVGPAALQFSAGRIEEYARCPYLFYLKRAFGLAAWQEAEPSEALDPLERGSAVHRILEEFVGSFAGRDFGSPPDELWLQLEGRARAELERVRPPGLPDLLWEIERDGLLCLLRRWLDFERQRSGQGLVPARLERPFGKMGTPADAPPYTVRAGRHTFSLRGRIDRLDLTRDGCGARVIDYKIGRLPQSAERDKRSLLMGGERVQLAVYRGALSVLPESAGALDVVGEYLHLQPADGSVKVQSFTAEELQCALARLERILEIIGDLMEEGVFPARSRGSVYPNGHCSYCDYLAICGKDRIQREERKSYDPDIGRFGLLRQLDGLGEDDS